MNKQQLFETARNAHINEQNIPKARSLYQSVISQYPKSEEASLAEQELFRIEYNEDEVSLKQGSANDRSASKAGKSHTYSSTYETARGVANTIATIGWVIVGLSLLITVALIKEAGPMGLGGLLLSVSGFVVVALGQILRATVDNADNTGQILALIKASDPSSTSRKVGAGT
jgi:hypothetical protein